MKWVSKTIEIISIITLSLLALLLLLAVFFNWYSHASPEAVRAKERLENVKKVEIGKTSKQEILQIMGEPDNIKPDHYRHMPNNEKEYLGDQYRYRLEPYSSDDMYIYIGRDKKVTAISAPQYKQSKVP